MLLDFKNKKLQSLSKILLLLCLLFIVLGLFFCEKDFFYYFFPNYYREVNQITFSLIFGLILATLLTVSISEKKYIFSWSSLVLILFFLVVLFPSLLFLNVKYELVYRFDSVFKKEVPKKSIQIELDKNETTLKTNVYKFLIKNDNNIDTVYFTQKPTWGKVLNKKEVEKLKIYRTIWRNRYILKEN